MAPRHVHNSIRIQTNNTNHEVSSALTKERNQIDTRKAIGCL